MQPGAYHCAGQPANRRTAHSSPRSGAIRDTLTFSYAHATAYTDANRRAPHADPSTDRHPGAGPYR